ncbi:MAG TPA: PAS domain S-box protein [Bryobacteraceae bacterium]|nr:PAS domain S-box protein [Bryobacteraceae bacterium]
MPRNGSERKPTYPQLLLSALLENTNELVAVIDPDFRYVAFSSPYQREFQRIFGVKISHGTSLREALAQRPADQAKALNNCRRALAGDEFTVTEPFGDERRSRSVYQARFLGIRDNDNQIVASLHTICDITATRAEQLRRSEAERERLEAVLDCMAEAVIVVDPAGTIVSMNPAALAMHEFTLPKDAHESLNAFADLFEVRTPDGRPVALDDLPLARAMRGEEVSYVELEVQNKRSGKRWIAAQSAVPVCNSAGRVILYVITIRDITERKRMEQKVLESEERARLAMQAGRMYAWEWKPATDEVVRSFNTVDLFGRPEETKTTGQEYFHRIHSEDRQSFLGLVHSLTPENDRYDTEYRVVCFDGQVVTLHESAQASFGETGRMIRLIGMSVDVSERAQAQATLRETEERFRKMADTAPVLIWISGPDKLCTFFNKPWLDFTGRSMEQEIGNGWAEGVHPDDLDRCYDTYSSSFDRRCNFQMEYRLRRADGKYRWMLDTGVPRIEVDGAFAGYIGSCVDITELKRSQEDVLESQKFERVGMRKSGT